MFEHYILLPYVQCVCVCVYLINSWSYDVFDILYQATIQDCLLLAQKQIFVALFNHKHTTVHCSDSIVHLTWANTCVWHDSVVKLEIRKLCDVCLSHFLSAGKFTNCSSFTSLLLLFFSFFYYYYCLLIHIYNKAFEFYHFWYYSLVWRWEIAIHSEMPSPRGVVKLWSAARAYIDLTCAWWSPWTNHMQPRFPLLADGCGRPRGALFRSSCRSSVFQLVCFLS